MANKTMPPQEQQPAGMKRYRPHHQAFSWLHSTKFDSSAKLIETTYDICRGVETVLEIIMNESLRVQSDDGDTDPDYRSLLGTAKTEYLLRLALQATRLLGSAADSEVMSINQSGRREEK